MSKSSRAMTIASSLRAQGMNPSDALSLAWENVGSVANPRRRRAVQESGSALGGLVMVAGIGTLIWRFAKGQWWWQSIAMRKVRKQQQLQAISRSRALIAQAKKDNSKLWQPFDWFKPGGEMGDSPPVLPTVEPTKPLHQHYEEKVSLLTEGVSTAQYLTTYVMPPFRVHN